MCARRIALDILMDIEEQKSYSNISIRKHLDNKKITHLDKKLITGLVYGVLENKIYLDFIIDKLSKTRISRIDKEVLLILRMGLYQIIYLDRVPAFAIVNESVELAKEVNYKASGFVNGLLRNFLRKQKRIKLLPSRENPVRYLSVLYSYPEWLVDKWIKQLGIDFTIQLLKTNNERPPFTICTNTLKIGRDKLIQLLKNEGIKTSKGLHIGEALYLEDIGDVTELESFHNGYFQVQDEGSMLVVRALDPKPGEFIIDVCAAPGGKTSYMAQIMKNRGKILARDIYDHKIKLIQHTATRLGISIIQTEIYDATKLDRTLIGSADKVLVDAPCSGLGVIRRKPEIKYNKKKSDLMTLARLQLKILDTVSKYLKKGGILVYSTCTINEEENQKIIKKFIENNNEFEIINSNIYMPKGLENDRDMIQLFPNLHNTDGFFICRLQKKQ